MTGTMSPDLICDCDKSIFNIPLNTTSPNDRNHLAKTPKKIRKQNNTTDVNVLTRRYLNRAVIFKLHVTLHDDTCDVDNKRQYEYHLKKKGFECS